MRKPTKRKMYQKRRKKEKSEQRKKVTQSMILETAATTNCYKTSSNIRNLYKTNPTDNKSQRNVSYTPITSYSEGLQLWWQTYCSAIEFHTKQQNAWHVDSEENRLMLLEKYAREYETSSEEEEGDPKPFSSTEEEFSCNESDCHNEIEITEAVDEIVNEDYMKFLEITHKHQEELRLKRAQDNC